MKLDGKYFYNMRTHMLHEDGVTPWEELTDADRELLESQAQVTRALFSASGSKWRELVAAITPDQPKPSSIEEMEAAHQHAISTAKKLRATDTAVDLANIIKDGN